MDRWKEPDAALFSFSAVLNGYLLSIFISMRSEDRKEKGDGPVFGLAKMIYKETEEFEADKLWLRKEIWKAHRDWETAKNRFEWAFGQDEVEYSVFALAAAENRLEMLLRHAKRLTWDNRPFRVGEEE
jgi:hypothetical protein